MEYKIIITKRFEEKYLYGMKKYFTKNKFIEILKSKKHKSNKIRTYFCHKRYGKWLIGSLLDGIRKFNFKIKKGKK